MKPSRLRIYFLASLAGLGLTVLRPDLLLIKNEHYAYSTGHLRYDSTLAHSGLFHHPEGYDSELKQLTFSLRFNALSFGRPANPTPNILQTAPFNDGVRIELAAPGTLAIIVGKANHNYSVFIATTTLTPKAWHTLDVTISPSKLVTVKIDGQLRVNATDPALNYKINDVFIGSGFGTARPFDGKIETTNFNYSFLEPRKNGQLLTWGCKLGFMLTGLILLYFLSTPSIRATEIL